MFSKPSILTDQPTCFKFSREVGHDRLNARPVPLVLGNHLALHRPRYHGRIRGRLRGVAARGQFAYRVEKAKTPRSRYFLEINSPSALELEVLCYHPSPKEGLT